MTQHIPKAELHTHIEGTITPEMARLIAQRNGYELPDDLFTADGQSYGWEDDGTAQSALLAFVHAYDRVANVLKTEQDYRDITYDYLKRCAAENCLYVEIMMSADHGLSIGLTYAQMVDALAKGIDDARADFGIEARLISTCVRHYGAEKCIRAAEMTRDDPHPYVVGFSMAGDENAGTVADFKKAYDICGLPNRAAHAGEAAGPESVRAVHDILGVQRIGHMVRIIEDEDLMRQIKDAGIVPEVCVVSNLVLKVYPDYKSHPLRKLFDYGFKVTLGSDDPSFFRTSIGHEYQIAQDHFGFSDDELVELTRNAINAAFVSAEMKKTLLSRMEKICAGSSLKAAAA